MTPPTAIHTGMSPDMSLVETVSLDTIKAAADRLKGVATRTPVMTSRTLDGLLGASVVLKCENLQRVGAFKFRGAFNALSMLDSGARSRGVLAFSSGNHAQAVALSAAELAIPAVIVMPNDAPAVKLTATRSYLSRAPAGSEVVTFDPQTQTREQLSQQLAEERGLTIIPPYDNPHVIAGQGTACLELIDEVGPLDWVATPCGGGGLLSGTATVAKALCPACTVVGVEPELADDATRSFEAGTLQTVTNPPTIADGARTPYLGRHTFPIVLERVDRMVTVSDAELARWTLFALERLRLVIEPTAALPLAGLAKLAKAEPGLLTGKRVGVIITGGNLDLGMIPRLRELAASNGEASG